MKGFANLFITADNAQLLITDDKNDEGDPVIKFELGTEQGRRLVSFGCDPLEFAQIALELIGEETAIGIARETIKQFGIQPQGK